MWFMVTVIAEFATEKGVNTIKYTVKVPHLSQRVTGFPRAHCPAVDKNLN